MKAVIMCGGEGTRLRPITSNMPKPMAPVLCRPAVLRIVELLKRHKINEIAVTLMYRPYDIIDYLGSGEKYGVKIEYFIEDTPLGTAGSVKNAKKMLDGDFLIISGDALCDCNLSRLIDFHRQKQADVTLLLSRQADPREYGVVVTDAEGRIKCFAEKPAWCGAVSDTVNTGIYVLSQKCLELIPDGEKFDFSKDLFPLMLSRGMAMYALEDDGYWQDIGDIRAYIHGHFDILSGKVGGIEPPERESTDAVVLEPSFIEKGAKIEKGAVIGPYAVVAAGCHVASGALVRNSVLHEGATIESGAFVTDCVLCKNSKIEKGAAVSGYSVIGEAGLVGEGASANGIRLDANARLSAEQGEQLTCSFDAGVLSSLENLPLPPEECCKLGAALASLNKKIGVCSDAHPASFAAKSALIAGILSAGGSVFNFGTGFDALCSFAGVYCKLDLAAMVEYGAQRCRITFYGADGLKITREQERKLFLALSSYQKPAAASQIRAVSDFEGVRLIYQKELVKAAGDLSGIKASVKSKNPSQQELIGSALALAGCDIASLDGYEFIIDDGEIRLTLPDGTTEGQSRLISAAAAAALAEGESEIALPHSAPGIIDALAEMRGAKVLRFFDELSDGSDKKARILASSQRYIIDPAFMIVKLLSFVKKTGRPLSELLQALPGFCVVEREVDCEPHLRAEAIRALINRQGFETELSQGVRLKAAGTRLGLIPKGPRKVYITAEAKDMETARSLCELALERIKQEMEKNPKVDNADSNG